MRFLVLQHIDVEHPGYFRDLWREAGVDWTAVTLPEGKPIPAFEPYNALVVMGGPMDVWETDRHAWLAAEIAAIRGWVVDFRRPYLGVCLGHQLLGAALGVEVAPAMRSEVGPGLVTLSAAAAGDTVFGGLPSPLAVFQWHSAEVKSLPEGATALASSPACAIQAMRWSRHAYGLQFHAELTSETVGEWADIPAYRQSLMEIFGPSGIDRLEAETAALLPGYRRTAERLNAQFLDVVRASITTFA